MSAILGHLAPSYQDDAGMNRDEIRAYLLGYFLGAHSIGVTVIRRDLDLRGGQATADLRLLLSRDGASSARRIVLRLVKSDDDWQVVSSRHDSLASP